MIILARLFIAASFTLSLPFISKGDEILRGANIQNLQETRKCLGCQLSGAGAKRRQPRKS